MEEEYGPEEYDEACAEDEAFQAAVAIVTHRLGLRSDDVVLDMAAGTGGFALAIAPHVKHVHARDPDASWLAFAEKKREAARIGNVEFAEGTLAEPNLAGPVSVVLAGFVLHHLIDEVGGPEGLDVAVRALVAKEPRLLILPDYCSKDPRAEFGTPLPHLEQSLHRAGYAMVGAEWFGDDVAVVVAEPLLRP